MKVSPLSQIATTTAGATSVALARKALRLAKANGQSDIDLIESSAPPGPDGRGRRVNVVA